MTVVFVFLLLAGLVGGYMAGLVGIGGGIIYVFIIPIALRILGVEELEIAQYTIANSIFAIFFATTAASYTQFKMGNFYFRPVFFTAISSTVVSLLCLEFIVNTTWYDVVKFNIVVIGLLIYILIFTLLKAKNNYSQSTDDLSVFHFLAIGFCSGVVTAISGLGGGIIMIPILNSIFKVDIKKAGSVSLGVIMITSCLMSIYNMTELPVIAFNTYSLGYIVFPVGLTLAAGVLISAPYGVRKASKLSPKIISYIYAAVLAVVILKKISELPFVSL